MKLRAIKTNPFFLTLLTVSLLFGTTIKAQTFRARYNTSMTSNTNGFYEYLPQGYSATGTTLYPLIISAHGMMEYGSGSTTSLPEVLANGLPKVISKGQFPTSFYVGGKAYKFIVLAPQFKSSASAATINGIIDYALKNYKVDPKRIYLTGLSAGGGTVAAAAADLTVGKRIAAVVQFAGTLTPSLERAKNIVANNVAYWGLHHKYDNQVSSTKTINMVSYILQVKSTFPVKKTVPNLEGHYSCWTPRYPPSWTEGGLNIYQWMLQFARGTVPTTTTNALPVANAGSDKTISLPTVSVTLSGSGTDADGSIAKYTWTKTSGPTSYSFSSTSIASPTVSALVAGTYTFRLTVTDSKGATDYDDVNVVVNASNVAPKANAGLDKTITLPTSSVTLSGSGTDADGSISKYTWTKTAGPSTYTFSSTTVANPTVSGLVAGTYTFRLTVTDSKGATGYDDINVIVKSATVTTYAVPGKVEAENYANMSGVEKQTTTDADGGENVAYIDQNDWMDYSVKTSASGTFNVTFRLASSSTTGSQFQVRNSSGTALATVTVPYTGGFQVWKSVTVPVKLVSGTQTLRLYSTNAARWNINYMSFAASTITSVTTTTATKVEAENYGGMEGVGTQTAGDAGGGENVAYIDQDDWMWYSVNIATAGTYTFTFRVASASTGAKFAVYDKYNSVSSVVSTVSVPNTGGWQTWKDVTASINLKAGTHIFTIYSTATPRWNFNYFKYGLTTSTTTSTTTSMVQSEDVALMATEESAAETSTLSVSPNPFSDKFVLQVNNPYTGTMKVQLVDLNGVVRKEFQVAKNVAGSMQTYLSAGTLTAGTYFIKAQLGTWTQSTKVVKL